MRLTSSSFHNIYRPKGEKKFGRCVTPLAPSADSRHLRSLRKGRFANDKTGLRFAGKSTPLRIRRFSQREELLALRSKVPSLKMHLRHIFGGRLFHNLVTCSKGESWSCDRPCSAAEKASQFKDWVPDSVRVILITYMGRLNAIWKRTEHTPLLFGQIGLLFHPKNTTFQVIFYLF